MSTLKAVIVDDEEPGRAVVEEYLEDIDQVEIVASFGAPSKAVDYLNSNPADLLFLDIQMPGMDGFELLDQLDNIPQVIFSTAHDAYALRAFEVNAIDYLLKPYTQQRFNEALQRVLNKQESKEQEQERIQSIIQQYKQPNSYPDRLFVRVGVKIIPIAVDDIIWIQAEGDYSKIHTKNGAHLCSTGLGNLEDKLDPELFQRSHRSYLLAIKELQNLQSDGGGGFIAEMSDGAEVKVSRSHADDIKKLIV
ncbi:LytR/AlgR family response regulator transcription factor [Gracilimonas mengyeensis]|uniref:Two component transcriptional regulator, LytTR family n=1 Tax=Gracilimonas mengyeensis TaxID=1302730 RepID=A0A521E5F7_9BACT|nr:LytTR family DNA-binding domain-containing protein [Gracilimonas mengyeensis]SMO79178.1 two component transcriptional regulator, LytTR family [Gracilimonas mengyeensis]